MNLNGKLYKGNSKGKGLGIFASQPIKRGELIFKFDGEIVQGCHYGEISSYWLQIGDKLWLNPTTIGKYLNHSCNPNSGIFNLLEVKALTDIDSSKEITIDYDTSDWDESIKPMKCKCGSENCRKVIEGYKSLPNNVREMYKRIGLIPKYLLEMEKRENTGGENQ